MTRARIHNLRQKYEREQHSIQERNNPSMLDQLRLVEISGALEAISHLRERA